MVRVLIDLRRTIARHQLATSAPAAVWAMVLLAVVSAVGTLLLGWVHYAQPAAATDVLALVSALWVGGRLAQCALSGEPFLRPELFALLPLPRGRLARAVLLVGLLDPANLLLAVALGAIVRNAADLGPAAVLTAVGGVALTVLLTSALTTMATGLLGPGSRRGHDAGTVGTAVLISVIAVSGTLLPTLVAVLRNRSAEWLSVLVRVLPSGWAPRAAEAAGRSDFVGAALPLLALALLTAVAALAWPGVLGRRMHGRQPVRRAGTRAGGPGRALGSTSTSAVVGKELRLWLRDPIRLTCFVIALVVGTATCVLPRVTAGTDLLLPFGGAMTVVIAGACACNLYGNDEAGVWLTILTPRSARADVLGRQIAWLIVFAPYAVMSTVALTAVAGRAQYWVWAPALLIALLGGGVGVAAYASLIFVQPVDEAGNPTPAWSLKVHVALLMVALTAAPTLLVLLAGWQWAAVPVGLLTGTALAVGLGRRATARLAQRQVGLLATLTRTS